MQQAEEPVGPASGSARQLVARLRGEGGLGVARWRPPAAVVLLVTVTVGTAITLLLAWTSRVADEHGEHRLLEIQTHQAAAVISSTVVALTDPLRGALQVATVTEGRPEAFDRFVSRYVGAGGAFTTVSLWRGAGAGGHPVAAAGAAPMLPVTSARALAFVERARRSTTFVVTSLQGFGRQGIAYAIADRANPTFVVYAERAIPSNRQVPVESTSAFSDINFVTYLGTTTSDEDIATTNVPTSSLPLRGDTAEVSVPFGDTTITLVATAREPLGGQLGRRLPWALLAGGALLTLATAWVVGRLLARSRLAERDAGTIADLYQQLDDLYGRQRTIAETLQQALLPLYNPSIPGLEIATRYVAGAQGVDIGGDWYSIVPLGDERFAFVVGDVSGRGVGAAALMARLRFTMQAYLVEGHAPEVALGMCSAQLDLEADGHFATALVGIAEIATRTVTLASAGHFDPLLVSPDGSTAFVATVVGPPLGVEAGPYEARTIVMPARSVLVGFTDGLVERRGEGIDTGLERLAAALTGMRGTEPLGATVGRVVDELGGVGPGGAGGAEDDIAVLAFRWGVPAGN